MLILKAYLFLLILFIFQSSSVSSLDSDEDTDASVSASSAAGDENVISKAAIKEEDDDADKAKDKIRIEDNSVKEDYNKKVGKFTGSEESGEAEVATNSASGSDENDSEDEEEEVVLTTEILLNCTSTLCKGKSGPGNETSPATHSPSLTQSLDSLKLSKNVDVDSKTSPNGQITVLNGPMSAIGSGFMSNPESGNRVESEPGNKKNSKEGHDAAETSGLNVETTTTATTTTSSPGEADTENPITNLDLTTDEPSLKLLSEHSLSQPPGARDSPFSPSTPSLETTTPSQLGSDSNKNQALETTTSLPNSSLEELTTISAEIENEQNMKMRLKTAFSNAKPNAKNITTPTKTEHYYWQNPRKHQFAFPVTTTTENSVESIKTLEKPPNKISMMLTTPTTLSDYNHNKLSPEVTHKPEVFVSIGDKQYYVIRNQSHERPDMELFPGGPIKNSPISLLLPQAGSGPESNSTEMFFHQAHNLSPHKNLWTTMSTTTSYPKVRYGTRLSGVPFSSTILPPHFHHAHSTESPEKEVDFHFAHQRPGAHPDESLFAFFPPGTEFPPETQNFSPPPVRHKVRKQKRPFPQRYKYNHEMMNFIAPIKNPKLFQTLAGSGESGVGSIFERKPLFGSQAITPPSSPMHHQLSIANSPEAGSESPNPETNVPYTLVRHYIRTYAYDGSVMPIAHPIEIDKHVNLALPSRDSLPSITDPYLKARQPAEDYLAYPSNTAHQQIPHSPRLLHPQHRHRHSPSHGHAHSIPSSSQMIQFGIALNRPVNHQLEYLPESHPLLAQHRPPTSPIMLLTQPISLLKLPSGVDVHHKSPPQGLAEEKLSGSLPAGSMALPETLKDPFEEFYSEKLLPTNSMLHYSLVNFRPFPKLSSSPSSSPALGMSGLGPGARESMSAAGTSLSSSSVTAAMSHLTNVPGPFGETFQQGGNGGEGRSRKRPQILKWAAAKRAARNKHTNARAAKANHRSRQ